MAHLKGTKPSQKPRSFKINPGKVGHGYSRPTATNTMRRINVAIGNQEVFNKKANPGGGDCGCG